MSTAARTVGFVGLGHMGFGMAGNLLKAGYDVLAYDVAAEPLARFAERGGRAARHPKQIGGECESVMVMVVDGKQVDAVLHGRDGLLETMASGTVMVCSTIALSELLPIAERARARGVTVIDCPVSGGVTGAAAGTLTLLCGGDAADVEGQRPILFTSGFWGRDSSARSPTAASRSARRLRWRSKPACRSIGSITRSAPAPPIAGCCARSRAPSTFLGLKDLTAAVESGRSVHQAMPVTSLARELYQLIDAKLAGPHGSNEVLRHYLEP